MRISVFGLGYVGTVSAACLARQGHEVVGVDLKPEKVEAVNAGRSPLVEPGLQELIRDALARRKLRATSDQEAAARESELSLVCVGTPSLENGRADLGQLERCLEAIGKGLRTKNVRHVVAVRSTVPPGAMIGRVAPWLEASSGGTIGPQLGLCYNPEFLREGQAIRDYWEPGRTVIAASDEATGDQLAGLYAGIDAPLVHTDFATAELLKYVDNAWHALKVGFANEIGSVAKALGVDGHRVMEIFCLDCKLNLSGAYLRPGRPFGGSCLPKDLRALAHAARSLDLDLPLLEAVLPSNQRHLERLLAQIAGHPVRRLGVLGLSFKEGTDDLRESPMVELIERLAGKGYEIRAFDPLVDPQAMIGANLEYALEHLPHIARLMAPTVAAVIDHAELLLIGHIDAAHAPMLAARAGDLRIIDCARVELAPQRSAHYEGICW